MENRAQQNTAVERGAIGMIDGVIAVVITIFTVVGLMALLSSGQGLRTPSPLTPAEVEGINVATDLRAITQASKDAGSAIAPAANASLAVAAPAAFASPLPSPTPFPGAQTQGLSVPEIPEETTPVSVTNLTYNGTTRILTGTISVAGTPLNLPITDGQGTASSADCPADVKAVLAAQTPSISC